MPFQAEKREQIQRSKDFESQLKDLEKSLRSTHILKKVFDLKYQINERHIKKSRVCFRLKITIYESGEKSGKLLARQLYQKETSYTIQAIKIIFIGIITGGNI